MMKELRFLLLVMAICFASGVKAQFYDEPDDIRFYVLYKHEANGSIIEGGILNPTLKVVPYSKEYSKNDNSTWVIVFNFDGKKAAILGAGEIREIKDKLKGSSSYYEDKVETTEYSLTFASSSTRTNYIINDDTWSFSQDRKYVTRTTGSADKLNYAKDYYELVDKSFFKVGRSRTPSGTMHE